MSIKVTVGPVRGMDRSETAGYTRAEIEDFYEELAESIAADNGWDYDAAYAEAKRCIVEQGWRPFWKYQV